MNQRAVTSEQWNAEGESLFGPDRMCWRFVCPVCGHVASVSRWRDVGASEGEVAFSCTGRHVQGSKQAFEQGDNSRGCSYAGGGLIRLNPVSVTSPDGKTTQVFEFARDHVEQE